MSEVDRVPPELTSFVGRTGELAAIGGLLAAGRALTLVGPGGCGKTRLAVRACREQAGAWPGGVFWAGLEDEPEDDGVARALAGALDVPLPEGTDPLPALVRALRERSALIAVDNCEHVLDGAARVIAGILAECPHVAILATSRATLGIGGERVWRVPPMDLPDALSLFLERARTAEGAEIGEEARAGARRVCDRLDRLPLALELAAGWAGTLSPAQIADSLGDPYALLDGGARTAAFRQRTLEESMRWSHRLLDEDERTLFRWLGAFEPGFAADAVAGLAALGGPPPGRLLKALRGLIDKSLVVADTTGPVARYRMLGVVRAYARARLEEAGDAEAVRDRHLNIYLSLAEGLAPLLDTDKDAWRASTGAEYANIRAAIEWGLSREDAARGRRLAASMAWLWHLEGRGPEGVRLLRLAAERGSGERGALQAEVLVAQALVADTAVGGGDAYETARAARELASEAGAPAAGRLAGALTAIGLLATDLDGAHGAAVALRDEALAAGDGFVADSSLALAGLVHLLRDEHAEAIACFEPALEGLLRRGDRGVASSSLGWHALAAARSGDLRKAGALAERAVATAEPLRDFHRIGVARGVLAEVLVLRGRVEDAAGALAPIDRLVADSGEPVFIPGWERAKALLALGRGRPGQAVEWCRREGRWQAEPKDEHLTPDTRLLLAAALRASGDETAAAGVLDGLAASPLIGAMPRVRAAVAEQRALLARDPERALDLHHEALRIAAEHGLVLGCADSLESLALLALRRGTGKAAGILAGAAERARSESGAGPGPSTAALHARAADPAWSEALDQGRSMELRDAISYAARARGPRRRPDSGWASLTPTERSVVDLAVQGLSNPEIAARLFMGRGTVKTHLAHVYAKLGVANRTELARLAAGAPGRPAMGDSRM